MAKNSIRTRLKGATRAFEALMKAGSIGKFAWATRMAIVVAARRVEAGAYLLARALHTSCRVARKSLIAARTTV